MDCCGMAMAVRDGGGLMCRRCGGTAGVPVVIPVNPFANWVTEAGSEPVVAVTLPGVVVEPSPVLVAVSLEQTAANCEAALEAAGEVPRGRGRRSFRG